MKLNHPLIVKDLVAKIVKEELKTWNSGAIEEEKFK